MRDSLKFKISSFLVNLLSFVKIKLRTLICSYVVILTEVESNTVHISLAEVDNEAVEADFSDIKEFIAAKEVLDIVYLVTSRSLKHLAILQEKYYQVMGDKLISIIFIRLNILSL